ncbi:hypothetical protein R3P38DRAFT_2804294 [Favolaschia claudopus]|uniref:Uncharacterized protein n=1 Tax=Favolaschia claudopus TaxID=2862362 RepID=A0AAV9ZQU1_9AGAR
MQNPHFTPRPSTPFLRITVPVHLRASLSSKPLERVVGLDIATLSRAQDVGGEMERRQPRHITKICQRGKQPNRHDVVGASCEGRDMRRPNPVVRRPPPIFGSFPDDSVTSIFAASPNQLKRTCFHSKARFRSQSTIPFAERTRGSNEKVNRFPTKSSSSSTVTQPPPLATRRGRASQSIMIGIRSMKTERWKLSVQENRGGMVRRIAGRTAFRFTQRTKRRRMVIGGIWQGRRIVKEAKII